MQTGWVLCVNRVIRWRLLNAVPVNPARQVILRCDRRYLGTRITGADKLEVQSKKLGGWLVALIGHGCTLRAEALTWRLVCELMRCGM